MLQYSLIQDFHKTQEKLVLRQIVKDVVEPVQRSRGEIEVLLEIPQ